MSECKHRSGMGGDDAVRLSFAAGELDRWWAAACYSLSCGDRVAADVFAAAGGAEAMRTMVAAGARRDGDRVRLELPCSVAQGLGVCAAHGARLQAMRGLSDFLSFRAASRFSGVEAASAAHAASDLQVWEAARRAYEASSSEGGRKVVDAETGEAYPSIAAAARASGAAPAEVSEACRDGRRAGGRLWIVVD